MPTRQLALVSLAAVLLATPADARVTVTFQSPGHFTDADLRGPPVLPALKAHLERLGARYLARNTDLKIAVLDVRLAGRYEPWRTPESVRFIRDSTWPTITVRYSFTQAGKTIASREETITDQFYPMRSRTVSSGPLAYEKAMLDDWFRERFSAR